MPNDKTTVTFLSTGTLLPAANHDAASFVVNGHILIDTGYYAAQRLRLWDMDAGQIDHLLITHHHPDHTVGLPMLLSHRRGYSFLRPPMAALTVLGPAQVLGDLMNLMKKFLEIPDDEPVAHAVPLMPGESYETDDLRITTCAACHPAPGLVYRLRDKRTGCEIAFTGDTAYEPHIAEHVRGVDLLVHDATYGASSQDEFDGPSHCGAPDAARCAKQAEVKRLALVHGDSDPQWQQAAVDAAKAIFPNVFWPRDGQTVCL